MTPDHCNWYAWPQPRKGRGQFFIVLRRKPGTDGETQYHCGNGNKPIRFASKASADERAFKLNIGAWSP